MPPSFPVAHADPCILDGVQPLLAEVHPGFRTEAIDAGHPGRAEAEAFVHHVFAQRHRADVRSFWRIRAWESPMWRRAPCASRSIPPRST